ncbi:hypothetical protein DM01DRAFT_1192872 [Hesseltinella vesiculosa]|uniref:Uncharacterized protein n=1 Tax=Hesseltinella vesiculosa TaxID=101127 RepID=A0A1X2GRL5_9FUNG|nr:hypothetical protein DM01DRAFT_1192872 [Hesseltinella vesiculosa]
MAAIYLLFFLAATVATFSLVFSSSMAERKRTFLFYLSTRAHWWPHPHCTRAPLSLRCTASALTKRHTNCRCPRPDPRLIYRAGK